MKQQHAMRLAELHKASARICRATSHYGFIVHCLPASLVFPVLIHAVLCSAAVQFECLVMLTGQGTRPLQALARALALAGALSAFAAASTPALPGLPPGAPALAFAGLLRLRLPQRGMRGGPLAAEGGSGSGGSGSGSGAGGSGDSGLLAAVRSTAASVLCDTFMPAKRETGTGQAAFHSHCLGLTSRTEMTGRLPGLVF